MTVEYSKNFDKRIVSMDQILNQTHPIND